MCLGFSFGVVIYMYFLCFFVSLLVLRKWERWFVDFNWAVTWDFQQCGMCDQQSLRSACAYAQSDQSLCLSLAYSMIVKLLTEHHLEFLSLKGNCTGSSESTLVKMPHCCKLCVMAQLYLPVMCVYVCSNVSFYLCQGAIRRVSYLWFWLVIKRTHR